MFQFPEFAPVHLCIQCTVAGITGAGFPIRTSSVQSLCSNSPKLFAATNVLHRLLVPRYPPCALSSLTSFSQRRLFHSQNEQSFWASLALRPRLVARRTEVRLRFHSPGAVQIHSKITAHLKSLTLCLGKPNQSEQ